jgi:DNA-directed RNA polymerase specialized sigma24 family protein
MSSADGSVTVLLDRLQDGDRAAAERLWECYFGRLVGLARRRLQGASRRAVDEEDVALSVLASFFRAAEQGRFPDLADRDGLWRLLVVMTVRKAMHVIRDEGRKNPRDGAKAVGLDEKSVLEQLLSGEPTPDFAAQMSEERERALLRLGDAKLRTVALMRLEGYSVEEIAARLGCVGRTVKRKLQLIRDIWEKEPAP